MTPKTIKIGGTTYKIKTFPTDSSASDGSFGELQADNEVIRIRKEMSSNKAANTLLHEALHGIWHEMAMREGLANTKDEEEYVVTAFSNGLIQVLKDNPEFTNWVVSKIRE